MPVIQALGKREPGLELNALLSTREMLTAPRFLTHRPSGHARFPAEREALSAIAFGRGSHATQVTTSPT